MPPPAARPQNKFGKTGSGANNELEKDRKRGALLGLMTGNALGVPMEGKPFTAPPFPKLAIGPYKGNTSELAALGSQRKMGLVSPEVHHAICVAQSLQAEKALKPSDVAHSYRAYLKLGGTLRPPLADVLADPQSVHFPLVVSRRVWLREMRRLADNSPLCRAAPVAVYFSNDATARSKAATEECALSHYDPRCILVYVTLTAALAASFKRSANATPKGIVTQALGELPQNALLLGKMAPELIKEIMAAQAQLREDLEAADSNDPQLYGTQFHILKSPSHIRVCTRIVFWEFLHASSFEEGLIDIINRGGDTDTHGAIAGALLGAFYGEKQIPTRWSQPVLDAPAFAKTEWRDGYDPRFLLRLADEA